ncbi:MAG: VWA domain-containing protein, partial [Myxococcota bacterium]
LLESATPVVARAPGVRRGAAGVSEILVDPSSELAEYATGGTPGVRGWPWWSVAVLGAMVLLIAETITGVLRPWRRVSQVRIGAAWAIRLAVFGVLLASLMGLRITVPAGTPSVVFVVDRSASVDDAGFAEARSKIEALRNEIDGSAQLGLVFVDGTATVATAPGGEWVWPQDVRATREERTDIGAGLQVGLGLIDSGSGGRIVLVTDGGDTGERLTAAREAAKRSGVAVDVVLLKERVADPAIVDFSLDSDVVRPGQTLGGTVLLRGPEGALPATLQIRVDDVLLTEESLTLSNRRQRVRFEHPLPDDLTVGPRRVEAQLMVDGPDLEPGNNRRTVGVTVGAPARALVVSSRPVELEAVVRALRAEDMQVFVERPEEVGPDDLALTDVVLLGDVPVAEERGVEAGLSAEFVDALRPWVSTGGGLITFGGDKTYELGGWSGTPLAAVLPLDLTADAEDVEPAVMLVQVLDNSASMGDWSGVHTKMSLANEGAVASMRLLRKKDQLGVLAVNTETRWVVRGQAVTDPLRLSAAIRGIRPSGGGIYTYSALIEAERAVAAADTPIKHVVIYADAQDAEEKTKGTELGYGTGPSSFGVAERLRRSGATISVIALGDRRDQDVPFLERLAVIGGGRFRITREAKELRALFVEETRQVVRSVVHDGSFFVKPQTPHPMLQGVDIRRAPMLLGYVEVKARPTADVLLIGPKDRPILVSWQYGLGNVASWSTDLGGRWGRRWLPWPDYSRLVVQQVRWALRPPIARGAGVDVRPHHDGVRLMVTRLDDEGLALPDGGLAARLDGGEEPMSVALSPVEPGTWTGVAPLPVGAARTLVLMDATSGAELARQDLVVPAPAERDGLARDRVAALAVATGGVLQPDRIGEASEGQGRSRRIGWFLALLAVLLLPIDAWIRIPPRG